MTGASAGLGKAGAIDLARRGARLVHACRSGIPANGEEIAARPGTTLPEMIEADLSDLDQVAALASAVERRGAADRRALLQRRPRPPRRSARSRATRRCSPCTTSRATSSRAELLSKSGTIPNGVFASNGRRGTAIPRIVFVTSETHRSSDGLDFDRFAAFNDYKLREALKWYGYSKLALTTFATELARRLTLPGGPSVGVHALCPGPVATSIARGAPPFLRAPVGVVMKAFFPSPGKAAAAPVVYLAAAPELGRRDGFLPAPHGAEDGLARGRRPRERAPPLGSRRGADRPLVEVSHGWRPSSPSWRPWYRLAGAGGPLQPAEGTVVAERFRRLSSAGSGKREAWARSGSRAT